MKIYSYWQKVFLMSRINGAPYIEPPEFPSKRLWPKDTWMQRRREYLRRNKVLGIDTEGDA